MKRVIGLLIIALLISSCSKEEDQKQPQITNAPVLVSPVEKAPYYTSTIPFKWQEAKCEDIDIEAIRYTLIYSLDSVNWKEVSNIEGTSYYLKMELPKKTIFYWKVKAYDGKNPDMNSTSELGWFVSTPVGIQQLALSKSTMTSLAFTWQEPAFTDYISITYRTGNDPVSQPLVVPSGTKAITIDGLKPLAKYELCFTRYDKGGNVATDTIYDVPLDETDFVRDYDCNIYQLTYIGDQIWLKEDLKSTHYMNGTSIPMSKGFYMHKSIYGENKVLLPRGFRAATDEDWKKLERYMGMPENEIDSVDISRGAANSVGKKLKANDPAWISCSQSDATNGIGMWGFNVLPSSNYYACGAVYVLNEPEFKYYDNAACWTREFFHDNGIWKSFEPTGFRCSVRCVKDRQ
jgi:uncharacterized protein (TIGR02145 family)